MHETTETPEATPRGFPYPDLAAAPREVREKFESLPAKINLFRMLAHSAGLYVPLMDFTEAVFKKLTLDKPHYELVVLLTATRTAAEYEWEQHRATAEKAGIRPDQFRAIQAGRINDASVFEEPERVVLAMADELLRADEVSEPTLRRTRELLTEPQVIEVMLVTGFYRTLAGLIRSVDLDYNPQAAAALAQGT